MYRWGERKQIGKRGKLVESEDSYKQLQLRPCKRDYVKSIVKVYTVQSILRRNKIKYAQGISITFSSLGTENSVLQTKYILTS